MNFVTIFNFEALHLSQFVQLASFSFAIILSLEFKETLILELQDTTEVDVHPAGGPRCPALPETV